MKARARLSKAASNWNAQTAAYPIPNLCRIIKQMVGWCDAPDLVHDMLDRQGHYFFSLNGFVVTFEVV